MKEVRQVHFIGVNHSHQLYSYEKGDEEAFDGFLFSFCCNTKIDLIAEELSEEAITLWGAKGSVARNVATRLSIMHLFCDPGLDERKKLGILTRKEIAAELGYGRTLTSSQSAIIDAEERKFWSIREQYWLERLRDLSFSECAFIIGTQHIDSFSALLSAKRFKVHVVIKNWQP